MGKKSDKEKSKKEAKKLAKKNKKSITKKEKKGRKKSTVVSQEQRLEMIAEAAYFIAEKHDFDPHRVALDWQQAEQQIDALLDNEKSK
ncbi:MAG: DUF2934 domain-containing protein [Candidatus Thiodiazotropha sp.]